MTAPLSRRSQYKNVREGFTVRVNADGTAQINIPSLANATAEDWDRARLDAYRIWNEHCIERGWGPNLQAPMTRTELEAFGDRLHGGGKSCMS